MILEFIELIGSLVLVIVPAAFVLYYMGVPPLITNIICSALAAVIGVAMAEKHEGL